ncbi:MAG: 5-formyltetrahydrofolate cyclo-ligase [Clostridia bacterium]|nr:5-formyltetrahydrofolate cyclo-ligase [Clostridia bacterium]MBR2849683.1 5-formyltetrahydrofolate cyclo-ligase [Clostridia bacterium]
MQTNLLSYSDADKQKARLELAKIRADIYDKQKYSELLCNGIEALKEYKDADVILLYFPTRSEPDISPLADIARRDGKKIAFPISVTKDCTLDFRFISSTDELEIGAYGIREPRADSERATLSERTLCIVPALAVDTDGYRLGYGKGYYDRFLSTFEGSAVVAIHSSLVCERLPRNDTDIPLKTIITETGAIRLK